MARVVSIGGAVIDLVFQVRDLPNWRQAEQARSFFVFPGGKGLNQAVAAARLGAQVSMVSAVADDYFGDRLLKAMDAERVSHDFVKVTKKGQTAVTCVFVNERAQTAFVGWKSVVSSDVDAEFVQSAADALRQADVIQMTLEVSLEAIEEAINIVKASGRSRKTTILLNAAPPLDPPLRFPHHLFADIDILVCGSWEAAMLLGLEKEDPPLNLARRLRDIGASIACVTTSEIGCAVVADRFEIGQESMLSAKPIDTTGGTDAFSTALAAAFADGKSLTDSIERAMAAGALALGKVGGVPSMPSAREVEIFVERRRTRGGPHS